LFKSIFQLVNSFPKEKSSGLTCMCLEKW